jgi:hypothetical protein
VGLLARSGGAVVLVPNGGVDVVQTDVVDGGDPFVRFAGSDEFGDGLGAGAAGQGGFAEAVVGVEDDGNRPAEGVEAAGVAGAAVGEVDLLQEGFGGVGELQGAVAAEHDDVESRVEADLFLDLEREAASGGVRLEGGQRVADAEFLAQDRDDRSQVLEVTCLARYSRR